MFATFQVPFDFIVLDLFQIETFLVLNHQNPLLITFLKI